MNYNYSSYRLTLCSFRDNPNAPFAGSFQTGRGQRVIVSSANLQKARAMFAEDSTDANEIEMGQRHTGDFWGFTTGRGEQVRISEKGLLKANALLYEGEDEPNTSDIPFSNDDDYETIHDPQAGFAGGFQTGRGAKIQVSKEGLEKAKRILASDSEAMDEGSEVGYAEEHKRLPMTEGFQTGGGKKVQVSEESLKKAKLLFVGENADDMAMETPNRFQTGGFQTGRGKKVEVSEDSLQKANLLFNVENANDLEMETSPPDDNTSLSFGNEASFAGGFQTGRGKKVQVSDKALAVARNLLLEDAAEEQNEQFGEDNPGAISFGNEASLAGSGGFAGGFQTGRGKKVQVSDKALAAARNLFSDDAHEQSLGEDSQAGGAFAGGGFQTGRGKTVQVSDKALAAARNLFSDTTDETTTESSRATSSVGFAGGSGFQTGRGKKVQVSDTAMSAARNLLSEDTPNTIDEPNEMGLIVFGSNQDESGYPPGIFIFSVFFFFSLFILFYFIYFFCILFSSIPSLLEENRGE
jgi:hypothetical protein